MTEQRTATDVILEMETKLNLALQIITALDNNVKILSNKINDLEFILGQKVLSSNKPTVEAINFQGPKMSVPDGFPKLQEGISERNIPVSAEQIIPQENSPQGFRRTSRPETYAGVQAAPPPKKSAPPAEVIVPNKPGPAPVKIHFPEKQPMPEAPIDSTQGQIPVMQRCVDENGKSIFLANVSIIDMSNGQEVAKTRTMGTGKWAASLRVGQYKVMIRKEAAPGKEKVEAVQDIKVTGEQAKLELPMLIIK